MKKNNNIQSTLVWLFAIGLLINLSFSIATFARATRLHNFYNSFSEEYRGGSGDGQLAGLGDAPAPAPAPAPEGGDGQCVSTPLDIENEPSIGNANAPVTIVEYSDFECPFCARFFSDSYQKIKREYIDSGQVRIVFKDLPLDNIHPLATPTAMIANCVADALGDEVFFRFHDRVFAQQAQLSESNIALWATELGLSADQVSACRADTSRIEEIQDDANEAFNIGINGTPSFVVNGELLIGAQPYENFKRVIDRALEGNGCST